MDKKGDIPITILVIGTFLVCSLALITFSISNSSFDKTTLIGVHINEEMNSKINDYNFYLSRGYDSSEIKSKLWERNFYWINNHFLINQSKTKGYLFWSKREFLFSCNYTLP